MKLVLLQKASKTEPAGGMSYDKGLVIYREENYLSTEEALWQMLKKDPEEYRKKATRSYGIV